MPRVTLEIAPPLLVGALRLPDGMEITGAEWKIGTYGYPTVSLEVDAEEAPEKAVAMTPMYRRHDMPDPVELTHVRWDFPDGSSANESMEGR